MQPDGCGFGPRLIGDGFNFWVRPHGSTSARLRLATHGAESPVSMIKSPVAGESIVCGGGMMPEKDERALRAVFV
jgi:hypothetical protein